MGAYLGDGRTAGEADKKVRFNVADPDFANLLNESVAQVLGTQPKATRIEHGFHSVVYDSAVLYDFLQQPIEQLIPYAESSPEAFLRGFFDAEGYVSANLDFAAERFRGITIGIANSNEAYLSCIERLLATLGMRTSRRRTHVAGEPMTIRGRTFFRKHDVWHLLIRGRGAAMLFSSSINFSIPAKRTKLQDLIWVSMNLEPTEGYKWFLGHYERRGRRWFKKQASRNTQSS
ncbi:MAG: hypothetical protein OK456_03600 [Thaumarchaeota archaeon]|nr:hypothetical protein [Nitrososphaerota archaeon]